MKNIIDYIREMEGVATPLNTMGMGNPMPPVNGEPGSEPVIPRKIPTSKEKDCKKKKKKA